MVTTGTDILTFADINWTESQQADNGPTVVGSRGTYILDGTKLHLVEGNDIYTDVELSRDSDSIRLTWLRQRGGLPSDVPTGKTLITAFPFHRTD
jgi:hypothetical protein